MRIINAMVRGLASAGVHPNILTAIGVTINVGCGVLFGFGEFFWAGIVLIVANLFDMLDGNVARLTGNVTRFGGFLDSSLDRLSDMVCFLGIIDFLRQQHAAAFAFKRFSGGHRDDRLGDGQLHDGAFGKPGRQGERRIFAATGKNRSVDHRRAFDALGIDKFFANRMPQVLWVLAVGSFWTFIHRMYLHLE